MVGEPGPAPTGSRVGDSGLLKATPGRVLALEGAPGTGLTRLGLSLLAEPARSNPVAVLDVRGWFSPMAAWDSGITPGRLVIVRCADPVTWARAAATLVEGLPALYAEVPAGVKEAQLRKLAALVRTRRAAVLLRPLRGALPAGVAFLTVEGRRVRWEGPDRGHGRLERRRLLLEATGKGTRGMARLIEMEDDADAVRVVPGVGAAQVERFAG